MLSLIAWIYGRGIALRNYLYDRGVFEVHDLGARVISVGNITAGGTGKTPLAAYIARELSDRGEKVCILTRGYGRDNESKRVLVSDGVSVLVDARVGGDEAVELAQKLLSKAVVIADADRAGAAAWAKRRFGVTAFVLDDGFQHRKVKRDIDIVCIDATDPFGGGKLLPAGRLREPIGNLRRADLVVITRVEQVADISNLRSEISDIAPDAQVLECGTKLVRLRESTADTQTRGEGEEALDAASVLRRKYFAFCGIGNPGNFFDLLRQNSVTIVGKEAFRDHHIYMQSDIRGLEQKARESGANSLITTAKDAVKLRNIDTSLACYVAEIEVDLGNGLTLLTQDASDISR